MQRKATIWTHGGLVYWHNFVQARWVSTLKHEQHGDHYSTDWCLCTEWRVLLRAFVICPPYNNDVIKWKYYSRYWPSVWKIHWSPVNFPHKGHWRGALMCFVICAWNGWVNNRGAGDLILHRAHYDVTVITTKSNGIRRILLKFWTNVFHPHI